MDAVNFENHLVNLELTPYCFWEDKDDIMENFFKEYKKEIGKIQQTFFDNIHLHSKDIPALVEFCNDKLEFWQKEQERLQQEFENIQGQDAEQFNGTGGAVQHELEKAQHNYKFFSKLCKVMPPIQEKDCWFIFVKGKKQEDKKTPPQCLTGNDIDMQVELEAMDGYCNGMSIANSLNASVDLSV